MLDFLTRCSWTVVVFSSISLICSSALVPLIYRDKKYNDRRSTALTMLSSMFMMGSASQASTAAIMIFTTSTSLGVVLTSSLIVVLGFAGVAIHLALDYYT